MRGNGLNYGGVGQWSREFNGATHMPILLGGVVKRRVVRERQSGVPLGDLGIKHRTPEMFIRRELRRPKGLKLGAELNVVTDNQELPRDDTPMDGP